MTTWPAWTPLALSEGDAEIIACRLDPTEQGDLMGAYGRLAAGFLVSMEREGSRLRASFRRTEESDAEVRRIAEVERHCCPFMDLSVTDLGERLQLTYSGPEIITPVLDMIEGRLRDGGRQPAGA
jgi:hypothetical protein